MHLALTSCGAHRLLLPVHLASRENRRSKREMHILRRFAIQFGNTQDNLIAILRFLQREDANSGVIDVGAAREKDLPSAPA